jgi:hypothetical protein
VSESTTVDGLNACFFRSISTACAASISQSIAMGTLEDGGMGAADEAIRAARVGRLSMHQMLRSILAAQVLVPVADPPLIEGGRMLSWKPATVTRADDGEQFVLVYTDEKLDRDYFERQPEYLYRLKVRLDWLITVLPAGRGIAFNVGGVENALEWPVRGILAYRSDYAT